MSKTRTFSISCNSGDVIVDIPRSLTPNEAGAVARALLLKADEAKQYRNRAIKIIADAAKLLESQSSQSS